VNYIKRLQKENKAKDAKIEALEEGLHSIESYLSLPKFREEYRFAGYANVSDIFLRIAEVRRAADDAENDALAPEPPPEPEPRRPYLNSLRTDR
jgi:hypothetical protein